MKFKSFYLALGLGLAFGFSSCDLFNADPDDVGATVEVTEDISQPVTWKEGSTYIIKGVVRVGSNVTIEAGATIKFMEGAALDFAYWDTENVTVIAKGTEKKPIIFTSASAIPQAGDYSGLRFYSGARSCEFEYCIFEFGGKDEAYGAIYIEETSVKIMNSHFRDIKNDALRLKENGAFAQFEGNNFSNIEKHSIYIRANNVHTIGSNNTFANSAGYGVHISDDEPMDVAGDYTWLAHSVPYIIEGNIRIGAEGSGVNLTIAAGCTLKFAMDKGFEIAYWDNHFAKIVAKGTADKPILFTSNSASPASGDYRGIYFYKGAHGCEFEHVTFEYAGRNETYGAICIEEASVTFVDCNFKNLKNNAIRLKAEGQFGQFTGNTFTNVEKYPIDIRANYVHTIGASNNFNASANMGILINNDEDFNAEGTYTWLNHDAPYILEGTLRIGAEGSGVNLTIASGTTIRFLANAGIEVAYWSEHTTRIIAEGTADKPITFTSNNPAPAKGDWKGIYFYTGVSGCSFKHCQILYAGSNTSYGAFMLDDSGHNTITIANSLIANSKSHGITVDSNSSLDYSTVTFENNTGSNYRQR